MSVKNGAAVVTRPEAVYQFRPKVERVYLDGDFEGLWADMAITPSSEDLKVWEGPEAGLAGLAFVIHAWNVADADGAPLPITIEALRTVPIQAIKALRDEWNERALGVPKETAAS